MFLTMKNSAEGEQKMLQESKGVCNVERITS